MRSTHVGAAAGIVFAVMIAIILLGRVGLPHRTSVAPERADGSVHLSLPPQVRVDTSPLIADYADVKDVFDAHLLGPRVYLSTIDNYGNRMPAEQRALLLAPGPTLTQPSDQAAVKTVLIDINVSYYGGPYAHASPTDLADASAWDRLSLEEKLARQAPLRWAMTPFRRNEVPIRAVIKNVPVRVLLGGEGRAGRIAFDVTACRRLAIVRERAEAHQGFGGAIPLATHRAELTSDGVLTYEGTVGVLMRGKHTRSVQGVAVRRVVESLLKENLLELVVEGKLEGVPGNPWLFIGALHLSCDGRPLLMLPVTVARSNLEVTLDERIAALGIDRYTTGTDETLALLADQGWDFTRADREHLEVVGRLAKALSVKGMIDLVHRGAPVTAAQQTANKLWLTPVLHIVAQRGRGDIIRALLAADLTWSRAELSAALVALTPFDDPATFTALLAAGANVNDRDDYDYTALMRCPSRVVTKRLLDAGADPTLRGTSKFLRADQVRCAGTIRAIREWTSTQERPH